MRYIVLLFCVSISYLANSQIKYIDEFILNGNPDSIRNIVLIIKGKADISLVKTYKDKQQKSTYIYNQLLAFSQEKQKGIADFLKKENANFRQYYIVNMISLKADRSLIDKLLKRNDIEMILKDGSFSLNEPIRENAIQPRTTEWGLRQIKAPEVWALGYKGQNTVIGGQDTGYKWDHEQLKAKYRGWNGSVADHNYNWHDAIHQNDTHNTGTNPCGYSSSVPCDDHDHGTHTMGTMVGNYNADTIGVAPESKWIGCRNMERGYGTLTTYVECFEWFLAPYPFGQSPAQGNPLMAPDVINNSWGCPTSEGCTTSNFAIMEEALNNLRSAGCVIVVSNGNNGSACSTTTDPPAFFQNSFSVGATSSTNSIASFSSRGPVTYDNSNRLKPNVSAPGVSVRSSVKNGGYATMSGTSMAGPHVAGAVALMLSAKPELKGEVEQIETIFEQTTQALTGGNTCGGILPTAIPNNTFGYGLINVLNAVQRAKNDFFVPIIKVDQFGYSPNAHKIAVLSDPQTGFNESDSYTPSSSISLKNSLTHAVVYSATPQQWNSGATHNQSGDKVWWFDFSSYTTPGKYYVADGAKRSEDFIISDTVYFNVLKSAFKSYYHLRCGTAKALPYVTSGYIDGVCHNQDLQCRFINDPNRSELWKNMSGGWHDAGDYNKYVNFAYGTILDLIMSYEFNPEAWTNDNMNIPESGNNIPDLLDEVKYELDWLLKMQDTDGGVYCVVGVQNYATASPPSADNAIRYYGPKTTSASFSTAAMFAFAALQFKKINNSVAQTYASLLQSKAILAFSWGESHPSVTYYNSGSIAAGEQELDSYETSMRKLCAAIYLYSLTGNSIYKTYVENNYSQSHLIQWDFVYPFENPTQLSLLYYAFLNNVNPVVSQDITDAFKYSIDNSSDNYPAFTNSLDAYRAYISNNNHVWGSNEWKTNMGNLYQAYIHYGLDPAKKSNMIKMTADYLHYIHGRNPNGLAYITNMEDFGADKSINSIYNSWFSDGSSLWDDVRTSTYGPAPGFLSGGVNPNFSLDACCNTNSCGSYNSLCVNLQPPINQPIQKSYRDWNTGWPQNSWEITENSIYVQASYLFLLSSKINQTISDLTTYTKIRLNPGEIQFQPNPKSIVLRSSNGNYFKLIVDNSGNISTQTASAPFANGSYLENADLQVVESQKGIILRSPNNTIYRISVNTGGNLKTTNLSVLPGNISGQYNGDLINITNSKGIIFKDIDGICYRFTISDNGVICTQAIKCE